MVLFYFMFFVLLANVSLAHICDVCDCQPNAKQAFSITCGCESTKHLQFTSSMMMGVESTSMVLIKNCQIVSIERNSFSQIGKLDTLGIQNCNHLYLATGAFSSLNSLLINNVHDISFGEMALMGARGIKNIVINSSNITALPKYSLFDVEGMERFSVSGVNIGRINAHAFNVTAKTIMMENIKVDFAEFNSLSMQAQKVVIKKSSFGILEPHSVRIRTDFHTRLLENNFKGIFQMNITSPFVEFSGNHFENFGAHALTEIKASRFLSNIIEDAPLQQIVRRFDYKDFHDNQFICKCGMNLLNSTKHSHNYEILKRNYCVSNCSLNLFEFEVESMPLCVQFYKVHANNYCTYERSLKKRPQVNSTNVERTVVGNDAEPKLESRFLIRGANDITTEASGVERMFAHTISLILMTFTTVLAGRF